MDLLARKGRLNPIRCEIKNNVRYSVGLSSAKLWGIKPHFFLVSKRVHSKKVITNMNLLLNNKARRFEIRIDPPQELYIL
jgi:hypothetical protein